MASPTTSSSQTRSLYRRKTMSLPFTLKRTGIALRGLLRLPTTVRLLKSGHQCVSVEDASVDGAFVL